MLQLETQIVVVSVEYNGGKAVSSRLSLPAGGIMPAGSQESFEYVVVGGGSGGCVVASRLKESGAHVLLLEAGEPDNQPDIHIPGLWWRLFGSSVDWNYETEPQLHLNGRRVYWPRGKTLGGSSSTNAMIYIRGHPGDYDGWAAAGNRGWSYEDVLPYFRRSEDFRSWCQCLPWCRWAAAR